MALPCRDRQAYGYGLRSHRRGPPTWASTASSRRPGARSRRPRLRCTVSRSSSRRGRGPSEYEMESLGPVHETRYPRGAARKNAERPYPPSVGASSDVAWSGSGAQSRHAPRDRDDSGSRQRRRPRPPLLIHSISTKQIPPPANPGFALLIAPEPLAVDLALASVFSKRRDRPAGQPHKTRAPAVNWSNPMRTSSLTRLPR